MAYKDPKKKEHSKKYRETHREEIRERSKKYWKEHKEIAEKSRIFRQYGCTLEQIDEMLRKQDHKCALCGKSLEEGKRCIDHNHKTGKARGILCSKCNIRLGHFESVYNDIELFNKYLIYLGLTEANTNHANE